jgi:hypothetical protein
MAGQPLADFFDSRHNTTCEIALPESLSHGAGDAIPKLLAHFLVYAAAPQRDEPVARGTTENNTALRSSVEARPNRSNTLSAAFQTLPQNGGESETQIWPEVRLSALRIACLTLILSTLTMIHSRPRLRTVPLPL